MPRVSGWAAQRGEIRLRVADLLGYNHLHVMEKAQNQIIEFCVGEPLAERNTELYDINPAG
ncbi:hypothetical protein ACQR1I_33560 [Bradyrhizobium sp. HKCCYLS2038]|uniref:hypothetical protein n=1 Tax=unclassified Bradyrhizobium TaxID=2631580 RepID=UPI003EB9BCC1